MIVLFTDFGAGDLYVGQVHAVLAEAAPGIPVIDLLHDAPAYDTEASAHLLAAAVARFPAGTVFVAVVDPGVGSARGACALEADGRWFVGPDNGLLSVLAARAVHRRVLRIRWRPADCTDTFHGRDLFAPFAARLALGSLPPDWVEEVPALEVMLDPGDLPRIIYVDHYGNCLTGLRSAGLPGATRLRVGERLLCGAPYFAARPEGEAFWYANSIGLAEIAVNRGNAAAALGIGIASAVEVVPPPGAPR